MKNMTNKIKGWASKNKGDLILFGIFILTLFLLITLAILPQIGKIGKNDPYNATAIPIWPGIQWYAVFIVSGLIMGAVFAGAEFKRLGWKTSILTDGLIIIAPLAILGARAYYLLFTVNVSTIGEFFSTFFKFRDGGLAIHGAIIVATIGVLIFSKYKKINTFLLVDILAIGLLVGQIAGRWGNFMNAEAHGDVVTGSFIKGILPGFIKHQMRFSSTEPTLGLGSMYHPAFLYESTWNFTGLVILLILRRKKLLKAGDILGIYLIWYGAGRSYIEAFYRTDQLTAIITFMPVNVFLSIMLVVFGGAYLILKRIFFKDDKYYVDYLINKLDYPWEKINEQN